MEKVLQYKAALEKRGFKVRVFDDAAQVKETLLAEIPDGASVGVGGSMTIEELGVEPILRETGHEVYWHWKSSPADRAEVTAKAFMADYYLMSANAIYCDGSLWNIDGNGNRVGTMIGGMGKLIVVAGKNKLTDEDPVARIKAIACPKNAVRLGLKTPCALTGKCTDCKSPDRMCKLTVELKNPPTARNMEVWLVNEDMGY